MAAAASAVDPAGMIAAHPLAGLDPGYGFAVPLLAGDHVTDDAGTGFVHTAPGHGAEDYRSGWRTATANPRDRRRGRRLLADVPLFGGLKVLETEGKRAGKFGPANNAVIEALIEAGTLLARGRLEHSYPHSWRSKAPVIFRNTPQWFIRMDEPLDDERTTAARFARPRCKRSTPPASIPPPAASASAAWSRAGPTG